MRVNEFLQARRRMSKLLVSEEIQKRIARLPVVRAEFTADILSGVSASARNAYLNESEVFALYELAAKMGLRLNEENGGAYLINMNGHPAVTIDFASLMAVYKRMKGGEKTGQMPLE